MSDVRGFGRGLTTARWSRLHRVALFLVVLTVAQIVAVPLAEATDSAAGEAAAPTVAAPELPTIRILPGSPLYAVKRLWERVRLAFTWRSAERAKYLTSLIRERTAELMSVSSEGKTEMMEALARDQERLLAQAEKALSKLKQNAADLEIMEGVRQAAAAAARNMGNAAASLPDAARSGLDEVGRRLGQSVQKLIGSLDEARSRVIGGGNGNDPVRGKSGK